MDTISAMKEPYGAAMKEKWEDFKRFFTQHAEYIVLPMTCTNETALHKAVYSKEEQPLKDLLALLDEAGRTTPAIEEQDDFLFRKDVYGNTVLHTAVVAKNMKAVELLVKVRPDLLTVTNLFGETPLFRAASLGELEIVNYLANERDQRDLVKQQLKELHRQRNDKASILHVAVLGEHFETAFKLLELDESLANLRDSRKFAPLYLLANKPSAFKSGYRMGPVKRFIYSFAGACDMKKSSGNSVDLESGPTRNQNNQLSYFHYCAAIWGFLSKKCKFFFEGWPMIKKIWEEKKKHSAAWRLANELAKKDASWHLKVKPTQGQENYGFHISLDDKTEGSGETSHSGDQKKSVEGGGKNEVKRQKHIAEVCPTPLLLAASNGIIEIVKSILEEYPQAVEQVNNFGQNILHIAVKRRQWEIFGHVKRPEVSRKTMAFGIDNKGYTLLHLAAEFYPGGTQPGPVLQLQEELEWFEAFQTMAWHQESVSKLVPTYYAAHIDKEKEITAMQLFEEEHKDQLEKAKVWIKDTSQSCSTVAVLVATVVFAAAYTAPGGYEKGIPIFLHSPYFMAFTILDVIALTSSLTAVVVFLSILTSPFQFVDFHRSLPRKLTLGLTLLFFSVLTAMLAFASTILLTVRLEKRWTTSLISIAAFLPVTVFFLMQFRLYVQFMGTVKGFFKDTWDALPSFPVLTQCFKTKPA